MFKTARGVTAAITATALVAAPIHAPALARASDLRDLVGIRASSGDSALNARGYRGRGGGTEGWSRYTYWWNGDRKDCVKVTTRDGRFAAIDDASAGDCGEKGGGGGAGTAIAVVAGAALIAALIASSKKKHAPANDYTGQQHADYDRGFSDGHAARAYDNYASSAAYSDGYSHGVRARETDGGYGNPGGGSYDGRQRIEDLGGVRASSADRALNERGFTQVDGFASGSTRYSIWNRAQSRQCVQVTVADGRVDDIRDIGTHPRCR